MQPNRGDCSAPQETGKQASYLSNLCEEQFIFHPDDYTSVINQYLLEFVSPLLPYLKELATFL